MTSESFERRGLPLSNCVPDCKMRKRKPISFRGIGFWLPGMCERGKGRKSRDKEQGWSPRWSRLAAMKKPCLWQV